MTDTVPDAELIERLTSHVAAFEQDFADTPDEERPDLWTQEIDVPVADIRLAASRLAELQAEGTRLRGWVEDAYLEGYSKGMVAGTLVYREEDWLGSKARAALSAFPIAPTEEQPNG